jgi:hypothetical protein
MPWAPDYVDVDGDDGLAAFVRADPADPWVADYGTAAARGIDSFCSRQFGQLASPVAITYPARNAVRLRDGSWLLPVHDVQDTTGAALTVDGSVVAAGATGYRWWESDAALWGKPYTALQLATRPYGDAVLTARYGWTAVPAAVPAAVRLQVNRWHTRRESPYGTAGSPDEGSMVRLTAVLDPDVRSMLAGLVRKRMPR